MEKPVSLIALATATKLSREKLRELATSGRIPCLKIGKQMLFNLAAVQAALNTMAATARIQPFRETIDA